MSHVSRFLVVPALAAGIGLLSGCGGGGDGGPTTPPTPPTLALSTGTLELRGVGTEGTVTATVGPAGTAVTWSSDQPGVATVAGSGTSVTVRAVSGGTATVTASASANGLRTDARVTVTVVPLVRAIALAPATASLLPGATVQLTPTVTADPGAATTVTWSSSDQARATVNASGLVTAVAPGTATITATSTATAGVTAQSVVTVTEPPRVRSVSVTPTADSALVGDTRPFTATVVADAGLATTVSWRSSAPGVATVSPAGVASALSPGVTTLTAVSTADTTVRASATFTVRAPTVRTIVVSGPTSLVAGTTGQATAAVTADPGVATTVEWTSSVPAVASVTSTGAITALAPGATVIRARSTVAPAVEGTLALTVTAPPFFNQWTAGTLGTVGGQFTDGLAQDMVSLDATTALANFWAFADGSSPNYAVRVSGGIVTDVQPPGNAGLVLSNYTSAEAGVAFARGSDASGAVWRYSGSGWSRLPVDAPGTVSGLQARPSGRVVAGVQGASTFTAHEWNGTTWSQLLSQPLPPSPASSGFLQLGASAGVLTLSTTTGTHQLWQWNGTSTTTLPLVPGNPANITPALFGTALTDLYAITGFPRTRVHRFDGSSWTLLTTGLAGDTLQGGLMCQGQPVVNTTRGRVYRLTGSTWSRLGTDAEILPNRFFGSSRRIACAADGTLRVAAGDGSIARWTGTAWVLEALASSLRAVRVVSPTLAWATGGAYSVYRWNGSSWSTAYRNHGAEEQRVMGIAAWPDGRFMGALWSNISAAGATTGGFGPQGILRFDGTTWTREVGGALATANAVWGPSYDNAFAVTGAGTILRFTGSGWTQEANAGGSLLDIGGVGASHALAIGANLLTWRWDGTTWSQVVPSVPAASVNRLYVAAVNDAWATGTSGQVHRFNGTTWTAVDMSTAGGTVPTWSVFGTGPNDVYMLRGPSAGVRALYRWNGTAWSTISAFAPGATDFPEAGSGVPGVGMIVGNNARWWRAVGGN
jgi:uncharacterized protein YjdB